MVCNTYIRTYFFYLSMNDSSTTENNIAVSFLSMSSTIYRVTTRARNWFDVGHYRRKFTTFVFYRSLSSRSPPPPSTYYFVLLRQSPVKTLLFAGNSSDSSNLVSHGMTSMKHFKSLDIRTTLLYSCLSLFIFSNKLFKRTHENKERSILLTITSSFV